MTVPFGALVTGGLSGILPKPAQQDVTALKKERPLSKLELAQKEMLANGITSDQRQAYMPRLSEALAHHVNPSGYTGHIPDLKKAVLHAIAPIPIPETNRYVGEHDLAGPKRIDAWRLYLGLPQQNGTFGISTFKPSRSAEDKVYFKLNNFANLLDRIPIITDKPGGSLAAIIRDLKNTPGGKRAERDDWAGVMGQYTFELGKDSRGHYLAYYDKWDLAPDDPKRVAFGWDNKVDRMQKVAGAAAKRVGKPFEIYDRIYYNPKTFQQIPESKLPPGVNSDELVRAGLRAKGRGD